MPSAKALIVSRAAKSLTRFISPCECHCTRLHIDLRLCLDAVVHDERPRVTVTKGRNSPVPAIREQRIDLRLTSLASLALTAPREERGREVCRIAVSFRRAGLFLPRIRIWLNHLPIKMPGGMTEHRQNDSETDEER